MSHTGDYGSNESNGMGESAGGKRNFEFWIEHKLQACASGEVIDKEWATRSYYSRHELQARASRGKHYSGILRTQQSYILQEANYKKI